MELVTVFNPFIRTGCVVAAVQNADGPRLVVDCKVKLVALVGHVNLRLGPIAAMFNCGGAAGPKERLNTVSEVVP